MRTQVKEWQRHPRYLADAGGLFGAPPRLKCQYCSGKCYELFYGHCRACAITGDVPQNVAEPQTFHDALRAGSTVVIESGPKLPTPWWHWRSWFASKK